jgi:hypothetical protein
MDFNKDKVDDMLLALMYLTTFKADDEFEVYKSWKGYDWDTLNRLHEKGLIDNPVEKAKSVYLTKDGARKSRELFEKYFG